MATELGNKIDIGTDAVLAVNKIIAKNIILELTGTLPLKIIIQYITSPVLGKFPLPTLPGLSEPEMSWVEYLSRAHSRMSKAWKLFAEGLEDEAGEEAWRAVIDAVNAVTTLAWGKIVRSHSGLKRVVGLLDREKIAEIAPEFGIVESLHSNYYEPGYDRYTIRKYLERAERIIEKVRSAVMELAILSFPIKQLSGLMTAIMVLSLSVFTGMYPKLTMRKKRINKY